MQDEITSVTWSIITNVRAPLLPAPPLHSRVKNRPKLTVVAEIGHEKAQSVIDSITSSYAAEGQANPLLQHPGAPGSFPPPPFGVPGTYTPPNIPKKGYVY